MSRHERAESLYGVGHLDRVFGDGASMTNTPWPSAGHRKHGPATDRTLTPQQISAPVHLAEVDPRKLWASQGWVLRQHAEYYLTGRWECTGVTSADHDKLANHWPVVMIDALGRPVIRAGHHRALAALVEGRALLARLFPNDEPDASVAITARVLVGPESRLEHVPCDVVETAVELVRAGRRVRCTDRQVAELVVATVRAEWSRPSAS